MINIKALVGSLILVVGALAPPALAHNDPTPWSFNGQLGPNQPTFPTDGANRVSGIYYKDLSTLLGFVGPDVPLPEMPPEVTDVTGNSIGTSFLFGNTYAYCDWEVGGP